MNSRTLFRCTIHSLDHVFITIIDLFIGLTPPPSLLYKDVAWPMVSTNPFTNLANAMPPQIAHQQQSASTVLHTPVQSIPTLADRLETYRQLTATRVSTSTGAIAVNTGVNSGSQSIIAGLMSTAAAANTIVSQSPLGIYTTSLVEHTQELRNWLKQAKTEHEMLSGVTGQHPASANKNIFD